MILSLPDVVLDCLHIYLDPHSILTLKLTNSHLACRIPTLAHSQQEFDYHVSQGLTQFHHFENGLDFKNVAQHEKNRKHRLIKLLSIPSTKRFIDPSSNNESALNYACRIGSLSLVRFLLQDSRVDVASNDNEALRMASYYGHLHILKYLYQSGSLLDFAANENECFQNAVMNQHVDIVRFLLHDTNINRNFKIDPSDRNNYALRCASCSGNAEIVQLILQDERVDPTVHDYSCLKIACMIGHSAILDLFMNDSRFVRNLPEDHIAVLRKLQQNGLKMNSRDVDLIYNIEVRVDVTSNFKMLETFMKFSRSILSRFPFTMI
jgi:hypothetical protein